MKNYQVQFDVKIIEGDDNIYAPKRVIDLSIKEKLPANVDAQKYLRARIAEELTRNFGAMIEPIDNQTEETKEAADPLTDDHSF